MLFIRLAPKSNNNPFLECRWQLRISQAATGVKVNSIDRQPVYARRSIYIIKNHLRTRSYLSLYASNTVGEGHEADVRTRLVTSVLTSSSSVDTTWSWMVRPDWLSGSHLLLKRTELPPFEKCRIVIISEEPVVIIDQPSTGWMTKTLSF